MNRCMLLMSMCLMISQLLSMEEPCINTADELKLVARTVYPEEYGARLKLYTVNPNAVSQSCSALLGSSFLPDGMSKHVETTRDYNDELYTKQIVQIMQTYNARHDGHICFADKIKTAIYAELNQKISEKNNELCQLKGHEHCSDMSMMAGATFALAFFIVDFILPLVTMGNNC